MRKSLVIIAAVSVLATGFCRQAMAIDVKPKSDTSQPKAAPAAQRPAARSFDTAPVKRESGLLDKLKRQVRETPPTTGSQKYNDFIDENGNGIDDRLEKRAKVQEQTEKAKPAATNPVPRTKTKKDSQPAAPPKVKP